MGENMIVGPTNIEIDLKSCIYLNIATPTEILIIFCKVFQIHYAYYKPGWLCNNTGVTLDIQRKNYTCISFFLWPKFSMNIFNALLKQYINIINYNNLLSMIIVLFFWNTQKSVNFKVVKPSGIDGKRTI